SGEIRNENGETFINIVSAGIGGSSLGPLFISGALGRPDDKMAVYFMDNTDPDGMDKVFGKIKDELDRTLVVVVSKSGGTIETRNCMEEAKAFYEKNGVSFAKHAVCITGVGSKLYNTATSEGWLKIFPMWDFVGGRTSVMSAVGMVPLRLQGLDVDSLLRGAADMDRLGRNRDIMNNPAAIMALSWYRVTGGKGGVTQIVLPYKDSLELLAKYLQQLVMESLGKEEDLQGNIVNQGLAVMGSKGSSDQHSYVQQLVGGPSNVFVTFVQILKDRQGASVTVGEDSTSGDYLNAFMQGTKKALESHGKKTLVLTVPEVDAYNIGQLIALFERAVGIYAAMIDINAYDQPAVEFGKKAAGGIIDAAVKARKLLGDTGEALTCEEIAEKNGDDPDDIFRIMLHMAANRDDIAMEEAENIYNSRFKKI
ncbi:MAG: glucose-6-phosphate isomerase, partial [Lachnospiraceae bacterium]|nr:glucose-6-phosphate isomerase [Lachnospiraceae bacterium]